MALDTQHMTLRGIVAFDSSTSLMIKKIHLNFSGELSVLFPAAIMRTTRNIIDLTCTLSEPLKTTSASGQQIFPFEILIPHDLPESFHSDFGQIKYTIKAIAETTFPLTNLKCKVPVYIHHSPDGLEELSEAYKLEQTLLDSVTCKITLPTDVYTPGEKFDIDVSVIPLEKTVNVTKVTCSLKEYTYFRIPSKSDPTRLSVAEFSKPLSTSSTPFTAATLSQTLLMNIPEYTDFNRMNSIVEVTHKLVVYVDLQKDNGDKDICTIYIPVVIVAACSALELNQLPPYSVVEFPPSYHASSRLTAAEVSEASPPPSYGHC
ncbi:hypothetical protein K7432_014512 [Basidiobolus ranarum]|uniref:Arrestin C-terminal-like domain-containing protein n=1 Tax=Basidiobolus ranarum TaxID=34480 RepID=A0ABR2WHI0_9FUNG